MNYAESNGRYKIELSSEAYGLLGKIIQWHAKFQTKGWVLKDRLQPEEHISDTTSRGKHEINTYKYDKSGKFLNFTQIVNGKDETRKDLGDIMQGTIDVASANFNLMRQVNEGRGCRHENMIFDSERSYRLMFKNKKKEHLNPNKYSGFQGGAESCSVEIQPEGGKWHKKPRGWLKIQAQAKKAGELPGIWFADLLEDKTAPAVPVKMMIKTDYGTFIAHLTSFAENSGK